MQLVVGSVHGNTVDAYFFHSLINLVYRRPEWITDVLMIRSGPALAMGRGALAHTFLTETQGDVLLMIDTDQTFSPELIVDMATWWEKANQDLPTGCHVLSGLTFLSPKHPHHDSSKLVPSLWGDHPKNLGHHFIINDYPRNEFCEVAAVGGACVMMSREVLEATAPHQFHHLPILDYVALGQQFAKMKDPAAIERKLRREISAADQLGEDISFARRARDKGYKIYAHTGLFFDHSKTMLLGQPPEQKEEGANA